MIDMGSGSRKHSTLQRPDGNTLAYARLPEIPGARGFRPGRPGVMFCGGFVSDMTGTKAVWLEELCRSRGQAYVRFDYLGHGVSSGRFTDGTIGRWAEDAAAVLDAATEGPQIVVGSSMGGWIAVLLALARPERIAGLVGVAAAPDFTEELIRPALGPEALAALAREGVCAIPTVYGDEPYRITRRLLDDGRERRVLTGPVAIGRPVRLIHGMADAEVPWRQSLRLAEAITGGDVRLLLVKDGEHRLSRPSDLALIGAAVAELSGDATGPA